MDHFKEIQGDDDVHEEFTAKLNFNNSDDDDDFSFVINGEEIQGDEVHEEFTGQIFPLFDQDLLSDDDSEESKNRVKVFAESSTILSSSSPESDEIEGIASGPYCVWTKKGKDKKSNSTGVSKLWRVRDFVNRSNSDGKDAFVFLNNATVLKREKKAENLSEKSNVTEDLKEKKMMLGSGNVKIKKAGKGKTATLSGYEIYIKNKGLQEDRKRSYLPYKPELFGFFTNVHGGLSRNIHPY